MEIVLDEGILGGQWSGDPTEVALRLLESDGEFWQLMQDLSEGGVSFFASEGLATILGELDIACSAVAGKEGKQYGKAAIYNFAQEASWVVVSSTFKPTPARDRARLCIAMRLPQHPERFRHVFEVCTTPLGEAVCIIADGQELAARVATANRRFNADLTNLLDQLARKPRGKAVLPVSHRVELPDTRNGITTITEELRWAEQLIKARMLGYELPAGAVEITRVQGAIERAILTTLLNHCDKGVVLDARARADLLKQIRLSVDIEQSVPVSITVGHGLRAPNSLKNLEPYAPPTLAWLYNVMELSLMAKKVEAVYKPGLHFLLFEEGPLFYELLGVPQEVMERNVSVTDWLIRALKVPVTMIPLLGEYFPAEEVAKITNAPYTDAEVFAVLCSLPEMQDTDVLDLLYTVRRKPFNELRKRMAALWGKAEGIAHTKNRVLAYRKKANLFPALTMQATGQDMTGRILDGAVTEKEGRLSFRLSGLAMFNHGATLVERDAMARCICTVVPEYRLRDNRVRIREKVLHVRPVRIDPEGFGISDDPYVWAYEVVRS